MVSGGDHPTGRLWQQQTEHHSITFPAYAPGDRYGPFSAAYLCIAAEGSLRQFLLEKPPTSVVEMRSELNCVVPNHAVGGVRAAIAFGDEQADFGECPAPMLSWGGQRNDNARPDLED
jgi:hypothetical protein